jgi:hypothetical protein
LCGDIRCIRLSNNAFRTKIAEVDGGLEVMMSAGFVLSEEDGDTFLRHYGDSSDSSESNETKGDSQQQQQQEQEQEQKELFDTQLEYALSRTRQIHFAVFQ